MLRNDDYNKIFNFLNDKRNILIAGHRNPDGDSVSAMIATKIYLNECDISNTMIIFDEIPDEYRKLPYSDQFCSGDKISGTFDGLVLFECDSFERSGLAKYSSLPSLNIDHHVSGKNFATVNIIDPDASSVCEMLFFAFQSISLEICKNIARALFTGIASDTGFFRFSNTSSDTFYALSCLMKFPIEINSIYRDIYENYTLERLRLIGHLLYTSKYYEDIKALSAVLNKDYIDTYSIKKYDLEGVVNYMLISRELEIAILIKEFVKDECFVSLRSKKSVDVGKIANNLNGGGHRQAAGFYMKKPPEIVEKIVIKALRKIKK